MPFGLVLSVLLAAVVAFLLGALWYSPLLFAKAWVRAQGHTPEKVAAMQAKAARTYASSFVAFLVIAAVLRVFLAHLGVDSVHEGAGWGFHAWLGFAAPISFTAHLYSDKPAAAFLIDTGYQLVYLTLMGAVLGMWL
jgi:hypothetical protein